MTALLRRLYIMRLVLLIVLAFSASTVSADEVIEDVQEFNVDGIDVILRGNPHSPVVSAVLFLKGGSSALPQELPISTEYFAMSVAPASGTEHFSKSFLRRRMQYLGTYITGEDTRDFSVLTLRCVREALDTSWKYFSDIIRYPTFDPTEFLNFKRNVILGINSRMTRPDVYSRVKADSIFFSGHPYGRMLTQADVERQTIENIREHFKRIMVKSRMLLSVVGNISREQLTRLLQEYELTDLPEGEYVERPMPAPAKALSPGAYLGQFSRRLNTNYALAYFLTPTKNSPDYYAYVRLRNFFGGFLFTHIRVEHGLAYAPNIDDQEGRTTIGVITFETPYVDSAIRLIHQDIDFFQNNRIRQSAIREGVGRWATGNYMRQETAQSQAVALGQAKILTGDYRNAFISFDRLAQVTPEQLQAAANKYLRNFNWVVIGDTTSIDRSLLELR